MKLIQIFRNLKAIEQLYSIFVHESLKCASFSALFHHKMSSGQNTMRTPTLQPVPESIPADHVSNSNKKKVRDILLMTSRKRILIFYYMMGFVLIYITLSICSEPFCYNGLSSVENYLE